MVKKGFLARADQEAKAADVSAEKAKDKAAKQLRQQAQQEFNQKKESSGNEITNYAASSERWVPAFATL